LNTRVNLHTVPERFEIRGVIKQLHVLDVHHLCRIESLVPISHIIQLPVENQHAGDEYQRNDELERQQPVTEPSCAMAGLKAAFQDADGPVTRQYHGGIETGYECRQESCYQ